MASQAPGDCSGSSNFGLTRKWAWYRYPLIMASIIFLAVLLDGARHKYLQKLGRRRIRPLAHERISARAENRSASGRRPEATRIWDTSTPPRTSVGDVAFVPEYFKAQGYFTACARVASARVGMRE